MTWNPVGQNLDELGLRLAIADLRSAAQNLDSVVISGLAESESGIDQFFGLVVTQVEQRQRRLKLHLWIAFLVERLTQ
jgi:hypothetical protein